MSAGQEMDRDKELDGFLIFNTNSNYNNKKNNQTIQNFLSSIEMTKHAFIEFGSKFCPELHLIMQMNYISDISIFYVKRRMKRCP